MLWKSGSEPFSTGRRRRVEPRDELDVFWQTDPQAYLGVHRDGKLIAGLAIVDYGGRLKHGAVHRASGFPGGRAWAANCGTRAATACSSARPRAPIAIDAVKSDGGLLRRSGFTATHDQHRIRVVVTGNGARVRAPDLGACGRVPDLDTGCFGAPQPTFLAGWLAQSDHVAFAHVDDKLRGYGVLQPCRTGFKVGRCSPIPPMSPTACSGPWPPKCPRARRSFVDVPEGQLGRYGVDRANGGKGLHLRPHVLRHAAGR